MADDRSALVLGATGLVGGHLLDRLLRDPGLVEVRVLARRSTGRAAPRLREQLAPLEEMERHAGLFAAADVYCCLGTTLRAAGSREAFRRVDLDAVARAAALAAAGGARHFLLVSAAGAARSSRFFYNRVKGEAEEAVAASGVPAVSIVRPSLLLGGRGESRPMEALAQRLFGALAPLMAGPLRRARPVPADAVARALHRLAAVPRPGVRRVENEEIFALAAEDRDA
jgi:uncharacterized protein YbjT (DUF2867 family)